MTDGLETAPRDGEGGDREGRDREGGDDLISDQRTADLDARLQAARRRIDEAALAAGRRPEAVTLIVVTKFFPAADVRRLAALGVTDVGENRHQEALEKSAECADLPVRWHYIGGLQSNKASALASYADMVHSVDRFKLVAPLARGAAERGRVLDVLVQVSLDEPGGGGARSGIPPAELAALAARIGESDDLRLRGLMAVAPLGEEPARAFARLVDLRERFLADHPTADVLSAGMSGDLEEAIEAGATHVRVGRAVLGSRPQFK